MRQNPANVAYSPLYFLASLGNGGLAVSFFIYLLFLIPHPNTPIPVWEDWTAVFSEDGALTGVLVGLAICGVIWFAFRHVRSLIWNIAQYRAFLGSQADQQLRQGNGEVQLMAIPLTLTMSINVGFVLGALFVPGLWSVVEWLFPAALLAFAAVAVYGIRMYLAYIGRLATQGKFDWGANNSLSQLLAIFAFAMIAVGFAAPAAMSHVKATAAIGLFGSIFFLSAAAVFGMIKLVLGFRDIFEKGVNEEGAPSLWIVIPILTLAGIAVMRLLHGFAHIFDRPMQADDGLIVMAVFFSLQLLFGLIGWVVMKKIGYFAAYVQGKQLSASSYALICPGVALMVFGMFFLHAGLIHSGLVEAFSPIHFILLAPLAILQAKTIETMVRLDRKHFGISSKQVG